MQYRELDASELAVGEIRAFFKTDTFCTLMAKMCADRFVLRSIIAPAGYGKLTLSLAYALYVQAPRVVVIEGLDDGLLNPNDCEQQLASGVGIRPNSIVIINDLAYLDENAATGLSAAIDCLLEEGYEVIVTARPSNDVLGKMQKDRVLIDAQDLLVNPASIEGLPYPKETSAQPTRSKSPEKANETPCAWSMVWLGYEQGTEKILEGFAQEGMASDLRQAVISMLALGSGKTAELALPKGPLPPKDLAWLGTSYPFLGLSIGSDTFRAIRCSSGQVLNLINVELRCCSKSHAKRWLAGLTERLFESGDLDVLEALLDGKCAKADDVLDMVAKSPWRALDEANDVFLNKLSRLAAANGKQEASIALAAGMEVLGKPSPTADCNGLVAAFAHADASGEDLTKRVSDGFAACLGRTWMSSELVIGRASSGIVEGRGSWLAQDVESYGKAKRSDGRRSERFAWAALKSLELSCDQNDIGVSQAFYPVSTSLWPKPGQLEPLDKIGLVLLVRALAVLSARGTDGTEVAEGLGKIAPFIGHDGRNSDSNRVGRRMHARSRWDARLAELAKRVEESISTRKSQFVESRPLPIQPVPLSSNLSSMASAPWPMLAHESAPLLEGEQEYPSLYLRLFGGFRIYVDGVECESSLLDKRKSRELLALLALREGRQVSRDYLVEALWSDSSMRHGTDSLYAAWSMLRRTLDRIARTEDAPYLIRSSSGYRVNNFLIGTDVHDFKQVARYLLRSVDASASNGQGGDAARADMLLKLFDFADELYDGKVFGGALLDRDSIAIADQLKEVMSELMLAGASFAASLGLEQRASWFASRAIETGGMREEFYRARMKAQIALGQRSGALDTFFRMQRFLQEQQGIDPSAESAQLYKQVLFDDEGGELAALQPMVDTTGEGAASDGAGDDEVAKGLRGTQARVVGDSGDSPQESTTGASDDAAQSPGAVDAAS